MQTYAQTLAPFAHAATPTQGPPSTRPSPHAHTLLLRRRFFHKSATRKHRNVSSSFFPICFSLHFPPVVNLQKKENRLKKLLSRGIAQISSLFQPRPRTDPMLSNTFVTDRITSENIFARLCIKSKKPCINIATLSEKIV
jgi:hypothetical protein